MNKYLVIPHLAARHINLVQGNVAVSPHSLTAMALFVHALGLKTGGIHAEAFAVVQHDAWLDADYLEGSKDGERQAGYAAWQRRGASLIGMKDYSSKAEGHPVLSLQPVITGNLEFSLVLRYGAEAPSADAVRRFLDTARFQGGTIDGVGRIRDLDSESSVLRYLRTGKWIVDRRDLLEASADPLRDLLAFCALRERETVEEDAYPVLWSSATVGYAFLTEPAFLAGARSSDAGPVPSGFAEAMTGLIGLYSVHDARITEIPFWESGFVQDDVFLVRGTTLITEKEEVEI